MRKVLLIGGGMITHDQVLPSLLHLQRTGRVGGIEVCARKQSTLDALTSAPFMREAFPGQEFNGYTGSYADRIVALPQRSIVFVATPDPLHYEMVMAALAANQHVICVKPLVLKLGQAREIEAFARERGLFVGVDITSVRRPEPDGAQALSRRRFRLISAGPRLPAREMVLPALAFSGMVYAREFRCFHVYRVPLRGSGGIYHRVVAGCGQRVGNCRSLSERQRRISVDRCACDLEQWRVPQRAECPGISDAAPGTNTQGLTMYCSGSGNGALIAHSDQYRGLKYSYTDQTYAEPSPDYFQYVEWQGPGLKAGGYGYRSIEALIEACGNNLNVGDLIATPANSGYNEAVIDAGRESLRRNGELVQVTGADPF